METIFRCDQSPAPPHSTIKTTQHPPTEIRLVSAIRKSAWRAPASTKATAAVMIGIRS